MQNDSAALASSPLPQGTQVIKDEFSTENVSKMKLQSFNVDGQVVYATMPSSTNDAPSAIANGHVTGSNVEKTFSSSHLPAANTALAKSAEEQKLDINNTIAEEPDNAGINETPAEKTSNKSQEYKTNISDKDLVKIAYNDAKETEEEAKALSADASVSNLTAMEKDSLSKSQLAQVVMALKSGDEAGAREFSRQSQLNADSAQQSRKQAESLDEQAKEKRAEAKKAFAEADELKNSVTHKSSAPAATNNSQTDKQADESKTVNAGEANGNNKDAAIYNNTAAVNPTDSADADGDGEAVKSDSSCVTASSGSAAFTQAR